jgi:acetoin utilization deacetylase AcuC-like enzyme
MHSDSKIVHVVEDIRFREHASPPGHPERPQRLVAIAHAFSKYEALLGRIPMREALADEILRVHTREHLGGVERAVARAPAQLDPDTFVSAQSLAVARLAAGSSIDLALRIARGEAYAGIAAIRPPGHHAETDRPMGFCLFNNIAIVARALQAELGLQKILILDWDVHHGNGTQHSFENDPSILFISMHQSPHYPGTGSFDEAGFGAGLGATVNLPMPGGCGDSEYIGLMQRVVVPIVRRFEPEMILVSCGFDAHRDDPLSGMHLSGAGYGELTRITDALASDLCGGRLALLLEGGYSESGLEEGMTAVLESLLDRGATAKRYLPEASPGSPLATLIATAARVHGSRHPDIGAP